MAADACGSATSTSVAPSCSRTASAASMAACTAASTPEPRSARGTPMRRPASGVLRRAARAGAEGGDVGHGGVRRRGVGVVVAGHRGEDVGGVLDGPRERTDLIERRSEGEQPVARDAAVGRLEADHAAERARLADRSAGVGAERDRRQAGGHRHRRAAARSAGDAIRAPMGCGSRRAPSSRSTSPSRTRRSWSCRGRSRRPLRGARRRSP